MPRALSQRGGFSETATRLPRMRYGEDAQRDLHCSKERSLSQDVQESRWMRLDKTNPVRDIIVVLRTYLNDNSQQTKDDEMGDKGGKKDKEKSKKQKADKDGQKAKGKQEKSQSK
jgi:hypothetical protein